MNNQIKLGLPTGVRLYTWLDVQEVFYAVKEEGGWSENILWARVYWDNLTLGIRMGSRDHVLEWLASRFDPRFNDSRISPTIILESPSDKLRELPVFMEETDETPFPARFVPLLSRNMVILPKDPIANPEKFSNQTPPIVVFHSFKGGVGRTLHAIALSEAIVTNKSAMHAPKVLLIDADLEAPGLTWLLQSKMPRLELSFVDLISLLHSDPDSEATMSIKLMTEKLREQRMGNVFVMPAFRSQMQLTSLEIKPEHLIQNATDPFLLSTFIGELGRRLEVQAVIIDLRAGFSELAAGLLLDPRLYRIFVTTLTGQSIEGTCALLKQIGRLSPSEKETYPLPSVILTQIPNENSEDITSAFEKIFDATQSFLPRRDEIVTDSTISLFNETTDTPADEDIPTVRTPFVPTLSVLPNDWDEVVNRLTNSGIVKAMGSIQNMLPRQETSAVSTSVDIEQKLKGLKDFTEKLIFAESGNADHFLSIEPITRLASDFLTKMPIVTIVGAKGSGKTYTYLQIVRRENWSGFCQSAIAKESEIEASICPVLASQNLKDEPQLLVQKVLTKTIEQLGLSNPMTTPDLNDYINNNLKLDLHTGEWREVWLNVLAWGCGFEPNDKSAGRRFIKFLHDNKKSVIFSIDGLEDRLQNVSKNLSEQTAIRSLMQDVPEWLEQQIGRPVGLIVFVRQDLVFNAITQNAAQFLEKHREYALQWNSDRALQLVAWAAGQSNAIDLSTKNVQQIGRTNLIELLIPVWGRKLGSEASRQARSAEWFLATLSDFKGQLQARDVIRFLHESAKRTQRSSSNRILTPTAMREAVQVCGKEKVDEIEKENPLLGSIFSCLRAISADNRLMPFSQEEVKLGSEDIKTLEESGIVFRDKGEYYMPEVFRQGLGFKSKPKTRLRILSLSRKALNAI